jgi:Protein of unknown function (DUF3551)
MRIFYALGFMATIALMLAAGVKPSAAAVIYPWCVQYGQDTSNCGFTSFRQCLATASGNGNNCVPNAWYTPYPPPTSYSPPVRR